MRRWHRYVAMILALLCLFPFYYSWEMFLWLLRDEGEKIFREVLIFFKGLNYGLLALIFVVIEGKLIQKIREKPDEVEAGQLTILISGSQKIIWLLGCIPLGIAMLLWGSYGGGIGFVGMPDAGFLILIFSYSFLIWYPFFYGLSLYFSMQYLISGQECKAFYLSYGVFAVGLVQAVVVWCELGEFLL
jgi:hypothetical protein